MKHILFEVSALEESSNDLVKHFEIQFSEPVSDNWLINIIGKAVEEENRKRKEKEDNDKLYRYHFHLMD